MSEAMSTVLPLTRIASYLVKAGDTIALREKAKKQLRVTESVKLAASIGMPDWVSVDEAKLEGVFKKVATAANGNRQVFLVHHHIHGVALFVHHDGADVGRGQSANHKLRRVFAPQHNVYPLACQLGGDTVDARTTHTNAGAYRVNPLVVAEHRNFGARAGVTGAGFDL